MTGERADAGMSWLAPRLHETPELRNRATYTVAITITVRAGARRGTAYRRAERVVERLANTAARAGHVVQASAVAGPSVEGRMIVPQSVAFAAANTGLSAGGAPDKLQRYIDPDHERALASLAQADAARRARERADGARRIVVGCHNSHDHTGERPQPCGCVYCDPETHYAALRALHGHSGVPTFAARCLCGTPLVLAGRRCPSHRDVRLVVLDGDGSVLQVFIRELKQEPRP